MRDAAESLGRASAWVRERLVRAAAVDRARGAPGDHIEHAVYPNHLLDARRQNRDDHSVGDPTPQALEHLLGRKLLTFEVLLQQRIVALGDGLEQLDLCFLDLVFHPSGNLRGLLPVHEGDAAQEPVHALEPPLPADGQVQWHDRGTEARPELLDHRNEVRALPVEVVHDDDVRYVLLLAATPDTLGDHLDRVLGVHHEDGAVRRPLRNEGVRYEPAFAGGINDVDLAALPLEVRHAHPERHAALDLLLGTIEHVPRRPLSPGGNPEHRLPKRGLPASSVPDQAHVPNHFWFYRHGFLLSAFDLRPYRTGYLA